MHAQPLPVPAKETYTTPGLGYRDYKDEGLLSYLPKPYPPSDLAYR